MFRIADMPRAMIAIVAWSLASGAFAAESETWSVSKSSGDVWITTDRADPVSLKQEDVIKPGDTIRTGRNGRVLLVRGEETILIAPNSVIGLPTDKKDGLSTTILQQAGSILLEVEKRNVKHFEVETPYLAAVVKGTQFAVTVSADSTRVEVNRGQVEVSDFKSGQIAQVMPGQAATAFSHGKAGLSLSGTGAFQPIEHGKPRASALERIPVPKSGLPAPRDGANGRLIHARGHGGKIADKSAARSYQHQGQGHSTAIGRSVIRISNALGEVRLNVHKATNGLAHGFEAQSAGKRASTVWSDAQPGVSATTSSGQNSTASGNSAAGVAGGATPLSIVSGTNAVAAAAASSVSNAGNGATGNGNSGNNGHGNNGNNGNGNHGVGNGNGNGNGRH